MRRLGFILGLTTVLVFIGCGDDNLTGLRGVAVVSGNGQLAITVSAGVAPTYAWTGGNAQRLTVTEASGGQLMWDVGALNTDIGFRAPVFHGVLPNDARESDDAVLLTAGTDYRIRVVRVDGVENSRVFRP
jgi:hypothetical protein